MEDKSNITMSLGRAEAVKRLHTLAEELEKGTVRMGDKNVKIPEKVQLEMKAEREELDIELKWSEKLVV